jgi:hypothetical protein
MAIAEGAPLLTCTKINDGYQYELALRADEGRPPITKIRIGPYRFKNEYQPRPGSGLFGITTGGPESAFWMHKRAPRGWSRFHWEVAENEPGKPTYLVTQGAIAPGTQGVFRFVSFYPPGGLRAGLEIWRGDEHTDLGVSGPNYEHLMDEEGH